MIKESDGDAGQGLLARELVPVRVGADLIYVEAQVLSTGDPLGEEGEIAGRSPSVDDVLNGLTSLAKRFASRLRDTDATRVRVEFGCELAIESGSLVAVLGKASAKSAMKIELEWSGQAE